LDLELREKDRVPLTKPALEIAVSETGLLATSHADGEVQLWDLRRNQLLDSEHLFEVRVQHLAFGRNGDQLWLATVNGPDLIQVRDVTSGSLGELLHEIQLPSKGLRCCTFSPDCSLVACGGSDNTLYVVDLKEERVTPLSGHKDSIMSVAFSPDGKMIASGGFDNTIRLWNLSDPTNRPTELKGHSASVRGVRFLDQGRTLMSCAGDRTIKCWDVDGLRERLTLKGFDASVYGFATTLEEDALVARIDSSNDGLHVWQLVGESEVMQSLDRTFRRLRSTFAGNFRIALGVIIGASLLPEVA
jgi:WD40 repeat protein